MIKINKYLLIFPLILCFFTGLYLNIGTKMSAYSFLVTIMFLGIVLFFPRKIVKMILILYKKSNFKYFIFYILWIIISSFILLLFNKITFINFLSANVIYVGLYLLIYYLYPSFVFSYILNVEKFYKFFLVILTLILIWGIIVFLGALFHIKIILDIESIISNRHFLNGSAWRVYSILRTRSTFFEPGFYALFISVTLPLIYHYSMSKLKIFKSTLYEKFLKKIFIPLALSNLILTFSPIGIIIGLLISIIYFYKNHFKYKKRNIKLKLICYAFIFFILISFSIILLKESTAINRITSVFLNINDIEQLSIVEPSLYARIVSYTNSFRVFLDNPITGVGIGNVKHVIANYFESSPLVLCTENIHLLKLSYITNKMTFNRNLVCDTLSETGIVGFVLFYKYFFSTIKEIKKVSKICNIRERFILESFAQVLMALIAISFYESSTVELYYILLLASFANVSAMKIKITLNKRRVYDLPNN